MKTFRVGKIDANNYHLVNIATGENYKLKLTFYGIQNAVKIGDLISMHAELLDANYVEYSNHYYFGPLDEPSGRKITSKTHKDYIAIKTENKIIELKRLWG